MKNVIINVHRTEISAGDSAYTHEEPIRVPSNATLLSAVDHIRDTYSFNGVTFKGPSSIWIVYGKTISNHLSNFTPLALTGLRDAPTDVFDSSLTLHDLDLTSALHFNHHYPNNLPPQPIIRQRYDAGSEIARRFFKLRQQEGWHNE